MQRQCRKVGLPHAIAGGCPGMVPMPWHVGQNAAKARGAETLCDEKIILFATTAAMHEHQVSHHTPECWQDETFPRELLTDDLPAFSKYALRIRLTDETWGAIGTGE